MWLPSRCVNTHLRWSNSTIQISINKHGTAEVLCAQYVHKLPMNRVTHPEQSFSVNYSSMRPTEISYLQTMLWNITWNTSALCCMRETEQLFEMSQIRPPKRRRHIMYVSAGAINTVIKLWECQCFQLWRRESNKPRGPAAYDRDKAVCNVIIKFNRALECVILTFNQEYLTRSVLLPAFRKEIPKYKTRIQLDIFIFTCKRFGISHFCSALANQIIFILNNMWGKMKSLVSYRGTIEPNPILFYDYVITS